MRFAKYFREQSRVLLSFHSPSLFRCSLGQLDLDFHLLLACFYSLSPSPSLSLSLSLSPVCLSVSVSLSIFLSVCFSVSVSVSPVCRLSLCLSVCLSPHTYIHIIITFKPTKLLNLAHGDQMARSARLQLSACADTVLPGMGKCVEPLPF